MSVENHKPLVCAIEVRKRFGETEVLRGVNLEVHRGEVLCIIGPSGSGKSTFLRCINQLETYQGGKIFVNGELIVAHDNGVGTKLTEILHDVVDKAVVAVDHQNACHALSLPCGGPFRETN